MQGFTYNVGNNCVAARVQMDISEGAIELGYAPLGVQGGIDKAKQKMDMLQQELARRKISKQSSSYGAFYRAIGPPSRYNAPLARSTGEGRAVAITEIA